MELLAHEQYQDTDNQFYPSIPKNWELKKMKFMANIQNGRDHKAVESDDGYDVIGSGGAFSKATSYLYEGESVLLGRKGTIDKPLYVNDRFWTVDTMYYTVINDDVSPKFFYYSAKSIPFKYLTTQTTLPSMTQFDLGNFFLVAPDLQEQQKIAYFLDHKTQQIDQLIEKKKALIEKLEEKRIAVITQAVTKGLDQGVTLVPSGVDWLGDVPEKWTVRKLRFLLSMSLTNGLFKKAESWGRGTPIVNVFDVYVHGDIVNEPSLDRVECDKNEYKKYSALDGDFFFVRSSLKLEGVGKSATVIAPVEEVVFECHLVRGRPDQNEVDPLFLNFFLNSKYARNYFVSAANVVTMATIDQMKLKNLILSLPPLHTQKEIVAHLQAELIVVDGMKNKTTETISKLEEYRSSLITAAVTGKIDVRNWQQPKEAV